MNNSIMNRLIIFGCITIILLIIVYNSAYTSGQNSLICGMWKADPAYCQEAGFSTLLLKINEPEGVIGKTYPVYLLGMVGNDIVINEPSEMSISNAGYNSEKECYEKNITFGEFEDLDYDEFPQCQTMDYYPKCQKIVIHKDDEVYGVFYKDGPGTDC